jgi:putative hemolysin
VLEKTAEVYLGQSNYRSRAIARWALAATTVLGIYLLTAISTFYPQIVMLLVAIVVISNTLVILRNPSRKIHLLNSKGNPIKNSKVVFCSAKGDKIKETRTNSKGEVVATLTPAFYTIKTPTAHAKTFNTEHQSLANLKLKLE